jgi:type III pantothenate kinase
LVDGVIFRIQEETGGGARVIATGGWSGLIAPECSQISVTAPDLTLDGLFLVARKLGLV